MAYRVSYPSRTRRLALSPGSRPKKKTKNKANKIQTSLAIGLGPTFFACVFATSFFLLLLSPPLPFPSLPSPPLPSPPLAHSRAPGLVLSLAHSSTIASVACAGLKASRPSPQPPHTNGIRKPEHKTKQAKKSQPAPSPTHTEKQRKKKIKVVGR